MTPPEAPKGELVLYQTDDGRTRIECRVEGDTIWLTQVQLAELFETSVPNINIHLKDVYDGGDLDEAATIKPYLQRSSLALIRPSPARPQRAEGRSGYGWPLPREVTLPLLARRGSVQLSLAVLVRTEGNRSVSKQVPHYSYALSTDYDRGVLCPPLMTEATP